MPGAQRTAIGITGNKGEVESGTLEEMAGVQEVIRVSKPYKLVSRDVKLTNSDQICRIACDHRRRGPGDYGRAIAAIESREQAFTIAERVVLVPEPSSFAAAHISHARLLFFPGLGEEGLKIMAEVRDQFGLRIVPKPWTTNRLTW